MNLNDYRMYKLGVNQVQIKETNELTESGLIESQIGSVLDSFAIEVMGMLSFLDDSQSGINNWRSNQSNHINVKLDHEKWGLGIW